MGCTIKRNGIHLGDGLWTEIEVGDEVFLYVSRNAYN